MKNLAATFVLFFCIHSSLFCFSDNELYLQNIDKTLDAFTHNGGHEAYSARKEIKELLLQVYENEKAYPDFIQCVTAQDSYFYAYQVITKELYRNFFGTPREDFEFLRFPTQDLLKNKQDFFSRYPSLFFSNDDLAHYFGTTPDEVGGVMKILELEYEESFSRIANGEKELYNDSDDNEENVGEDEKYSRYLINDTLQEVSREIISVNFTMETYRPLDSAMFVFLTGGSVSLSSLSNSEEEYLQKLTNILYEPFDSLSIPKDKGSSQK